MFQPSVPVTCFEEDQPSAGIDDQRAPLLQNLDYKQQHNPLTGRVTPVELKEVKKAVENNNGENINL